MKTPLLPLLLALPCVSAGAAEWFPALPGIGESQYVIYRDFCGERGPVGRPKLREFDATRGEWVLRVTVDQGLCFGTPAPGSARVYAFEIPLEVEGRPINLVYVETVAGEQSPVDTLPRPVAREVPPSIGGTWTKPAASR